ncbi:MAG: OmpA family protein [Mariprofundaceae bacterium]|nr:OmpA family protein [Mariprofundaceae bacterium]
MLPSCTTVPVHTNYPQLTEIKKMIQDAKNADAEDCAPQTLASAVSLLYWAAHELDENGAEAAETDALFREAEAYAQQAKEKAVHNCSVPRTTVILLPDEDGKVGAIIVKTKNKELLINKAYHFSSVIREEDTLTDMAKGDKIYIDKKFEQIINSQPLKPAHFTFLFTTGSTELTPASKQTLPTLIPALNARIPAVIHVDGHADTMASQQFNLTLSKKRAQHIATFLHDTGIKIHRIHLKFYGENQLAVSTKNDINEPKNRRVEIMIY